MARLDTYRRMQIIHLLLGMMFFWGIEQLFINTFHSASGRGWVSLAYILTLLVFDIPLGVIADRFGRKPCLIAACIVQVIALFAMAASHDLGLYIVGTVLFGAYSALYNGSAQALLYDWLKESNRQAEYSKLQGRLYAYYLAGAGIANVLSGIVTHYSSLRATYLLSVLPSLFAAGFCLGLSESRHSSENLEQEHASKVSGVIREIRRHPRILIFGLQFVLFEIIFETISEFGQIYMLAFGVSAIVLGILWAITALLGTISLFNTQYMRNRPRIWMALYCIVLCIFMMIHNQIGIALFFVIYGLTEALSTVAETEIQDETSSSIRATMLSTSGFAANLIGAPIIILYTYIYSHHGIFTANRWVAISVAVIMTGTLFVKPPKQKVDITSEPIPVRTA